MIYMDNVTNPFFPVLPNTVGGVFVFKLMVKGGERLISDETLKKFSHLFFHLGNESCHTYVRHYTLIC